MGALLIGMETALYMMNRLKVYLSYLRDLPDLLGRTEFGNSLTQFYAQILEFLASAFRIYQKNFVARALGSFWKLEDVVDFEAKCDKLANRVERDAQNC